MPHGAEKRAVAKGYIWSLRLVCRYIPSRLGLFYEVRHEGNSRPGYQIPYLWISVYKSPLIGSADISFTSTIIRPPGEGMLYSIQV